MQTAHYSISEIIIAVATDNDATGKNGITMRGGVAARGVRRRGDGREFTSTYLMCRGNNRTIASLLVEFFGN